MHLEHCLAALSTGPRPESFRVVAKTLDPQWVVMALAMAGHLSLRRRLLPAPVVVWLVLGMALFRDQSIPSVCTQLSLSLPAVGGGLERPGRRPVSSSALVQARERVGFEPLKQLFALSAERWVAELAGLNQWKGLDLYGVDGSTLRVADTPENEAHFGWPGSSRGKSSYPLVRVVGLLALRSRVLAGAVVGRYRDSEQTLARSLWDQLPENSLVIEDRGFVNHAEFARACARPGSRHFLARGKKNTRWTLVAELGPGDRLVDLEVPAAQRKADPTLSKTVRVRAIPYYTPAQKEPQLLLTSLTDAETYPAAELVALYRERWEIEIGYAEVKTETLEREETLRSKSPDRVLQEVWGLFVAYNLVRVMMARAAMEAGVPPFRMSYRNSLLRIRYFLVSAGMGAPGNIPKLYRRLCEELAELVLPPRRVRSYPRAVKLKMSNYKRKTMT